MGSTVVPCFAARRGGPCPKHRAPAPKIVLETLALGSMRRFCRAKLPRHKKKPWGVAFQRTSNWEASTTKSAHAGPLHPAVRDSLTGGNEPNETGFAKRGLERHQKNSPMGPRHFNMGHAAGTPKFRKFGCRYPLCEITGIFPYKYPAFAFYTGFIK